VKEIKNVAVLGAGAMGAVFASRFFDASPFSAVLVARDPRYDRLRAEGLVVNGKHNSIPVVHPDEAAPPADLIIVALKNHNLPEAINDLKNLVSGETTLISVMNGLDSEEYLGSVYGMDKVLYSHSLKFCRNGAGFSVFIFPVDKPSEGLGESIDELIFGFGIEPGEPFGLHDEPEPFNGVKIR
jgi:ketopantoate reductase